MVIFEYFFFTSFWCEGYYWVILFLLPVNIIFGIYVVHFSAILFSMIFLTILKLIHPPKEGVFQRNLQDKDYFYWNLRNLIKKWPLYIMASNPLPWLKNRFTLRFFGVHIGKNCISDNSWISSEFVSVGKNVIIGMASTILSFGMEPQRFIIKKIVIEDNCVIGAKCVLLPGTVVKRNTKLSAHSYTSYDQILEPDSIYMGHPAKIHK